MSDVKTKLYENFNWDDILVRSVIAGVLDLLNNRIDYSQVWDDNVTEKVKVPWMYSMGSSDERFIQDNYTFFGKKCFGDEMITGTFNSIPRGYLTYNGSKIESNAITNRFIQGKYMKNENGRLTTYTSFIYVMPLTIDFDCKIICDNVLSALKIEQAIREVFYKNKTFYVYFRGMRIGCCAGFPEQYSNDIFKTTDYSFDNVQKTPQISFSLSVETYHPIFDRTQEIEASKKIMAFGGDLYLKDTEQKEAIKILNKDENIQYPSGIPYLVEWVYSSTYSEFLTVNLSYIDDCGCETVIENGINNQGFYIWNIPEDFGTFKQPEININVPEDYILKKPVIKIVPKQIEGKEGYYLTSESFITVDPGFIVSSYEYEVLPISIEYKNSKGKLVIIPEGKYYINLVDGKVDNTEPVRLGLKNEEIVPSKFEGNVEFKKITLKIQKAGHSEIFDEKTNLLIL